MIRSDSHKFIFLRVPKNASSSLAQWLIMNYTDKDDIYTEVNDGGIPHRGVNFMRKYHKDSHFIHMRLQELFDEGVVHKGHLKDYETIAVIRNPLERQLSLFFFLSRLHGYQPTVEKFRKDFAGGCHMEDTNNQILQTDYTTVNGVDHGTWWVYENIESHVREFEKKHGKAKSILGKLKAGITPLDKINEFYDDKTRRAVYEYYQKDFNLYEALKGG